MDLWLILVVPGIAAAFAGLALLWLMGGALE